MTMEALAREAGVARSTVSKAFSGSREVSEKTRERIFDIARKHGVFDKYIQRKSEKRVIAVIVPEFHSGLYCQWLHWMQKEITSRGGIMLAAADSFDEGKRAELFTYFTECMKADGVILSSPLPLKQPCSSAVLSIGESSMCDSICLSRTKAFSDAIRYLKEHGHTKIAVITESLTKSLAERFCCTMRENGLSLSEAYIAKTPLRFEEGGYNAMSRLIALDDPPTAILAAYDNMALGALKCILDRGYSVPEDFSVIGFDDNVNNPYLNVPLSSITMYNEDLCQIAVGTLFERIEIGNSVPPRKIRVSGSFVPRASVGHAKK